MAHITDISKQVKNPGRINLYLDGEFYCGLDEFTAAAHRLRIDGEVDAEELARIVFDEECNSAFEKAMRFINVRMRSESEIRRILTEKRYSDIVIDTTVEKLASYRYIDDAEFARLYIEAHRKKWGVKKLKYALIPFGIDSEILESLFLDMPDQDEEAYKLAIKYIGSKELDMRKVYAHLLQKGFDGDTIGRVITRIKENEGE